MVRLHFVDNKLTLETEGDGRLSSGLIRTSLVFDCGFAYLPEDAKYALDENSDWRKAVEYVIDMLEAEKIEVSLDQKSNEAIEERRKRVTNFRRFIADGNKIKAEGTRSQVKPPGFRVPLLDSQRRAVAFHISLPFSADFSVPGSGKTWIAYAIYGILRRKKEIHRLLVVCPISAFKPWQEEYRVVFGKQPNCTEIRGTKLERRASFSKALDSIILDFLSQPSQRRTLHQVLAAASKLHGDLGRIAPCETT